MHKLFFTVMTALFGLSLALPAAAHTGMSEYSLMHVVLHIATSVSVYLAIMAAGFLLFKGLPKAIKQRVKK